MPDDGRTVVNDRVPRHYRAFRLVLVGLALAVLAAFGWLLVQPGALDELLRLIRSIGDLLGG